jgi:hypothetical protein
MNTNVNNAEEGRSGRRIRNRDRPAEYFESEEYKQRKEDYEKRMNERLRQLRIEEDKKRQEQKMLEMRLEKSMGTQTEAIKKPTYKELQKQPFLARITAQLETNDHDGYCSSEECEYKKKIIKMNIPVPDNYYMCYPGELDERQKKIHNWANHLPVPEVNVEGSEYCKYHCPKGGVGPHEYRYTIKKVEIIENPKYDESKDDYTTIKTITAAEMIAALSKLPPDAKLVITESGFYSNSEFSEVKLPEEYIVGSKGVIDERIRGLSKGAKVYRIGHSEQHY